MDEEILSHSLIVENKTQSILFSNFENCLAAKILISEIVKL